MLGFLLVTFPTAYKQWISLKQPVSSTPGVERENESPIITRTIDLGPIQIHQKLLGTLEAPQPPLRIVIPSLSVDIPIIEARVVDGFWELSETTASHGVGSANPGEVGNTVIFAHAREGLFGPLRNLKNDATVYVFSKDRWYRYQVTETKLVDPGAVEVIAPTDDETLTLYTCSGFLDTKRLIVTAKPLRP